MRILYLYLFPLWGNGSGAYLRELSHQLVEKGHTVGIVAPDKRRLEGVKHYQVRPPQNGVFVGHPEMPNAKKWGDMNGNELGEIYSSYLKTSIEAVQDFRPGVVHVFHTAFLPDIGRVIRALFGTKFIMTTHGSDLAYLAKDKRFIPLIADANRAAKTITAVSDFTKHWYLEIFGHELNKKMTTVVGGVNLSHYKRDPKLIDEINRKYNLKDKKVVLFTGRLTEHKGVLYLVRAAARMNNAVVLIVGDGPEREKLQAEVKKKGLPNVVFTGYINTANPLFHAFYERADVFVSPSLWDEPLGLTILEAMAAHTPVVATRKGGVLEMINEGVNGFLVRARNSTELADVVNLLLADDKMRERIANAAYKTVVDRFSWEKIAQRFEKIYEAARGKEKFDAGPLDDLLTRIFYGK